MQKIVLITCVSKKAGQKAKARDLYISQLFKSSLAYARSLKPDKVFILSALYHLLELETEIEPYDVTLSNVPQSKRKASVKILNKAEKKQWGEKVIQQLSDITSLKDDQFIILAGLEYIKPLQHHINYLHNPLKGLSQGQRVSFMKNAIK